MEIKAVIRLECLKLAHRHDRSPAQVVEVAEIYEQYVKGAEVPASEIRPSAGDAVEGEPSISRKTLSLNSNRKSVKS